MQRAFVIRPFGTKKDLAGKAIDFEAIHRELIEPALIAAGLTGSTTAEVIDAGNIREDMFGLIVGGDLVICDVTVHNPNVFYELGVRHAVRKKGSILIKGRPVEETTPFDLLTDRYLAYEIANPAKAKDDLVRAIKATLAGDREADSPVFTMLPALREQDTSAIQIVPPDLSEEISRAEAGNSPGWLRLLRSESEGQLFRWPALRLIGAAQLRLKDYQGSRDTWEIVRDNDRNDVSANLALADIYERLYGLDNQDAGLLEKSNQAIARVINNRDVSTKDRARALALEGRNAKTVWRIGFESLPDIAQRRAAALNPDLLKACEPYYEAYLADLNHYYPALAALQMGVIMQDLSQEPEWADLFPTDTKAQEYKAKLEDELASLRSAVRLSLEAAFKQFPRGHKDRVFAEISEADLLFLSDDRPRRVAAAYVDAIPKGDRFSWDAARRQLELFAGLGIKSEIALHAIDKVEAKVKTAVAPETHVVVVGGHRIDEPGRTNPRFPEALEGTARDHIRRELAKAKSGGKKVVVLASGAPGADIICHEVCRELEIESTLCLPMPREDFASTCFQQQDAWRRRFLNLSGVRTLQLSDNKDGIPRWLRATNKNAWERGNQWVLEMARSYGAREITAIALWDGKPTGDARGGTAHMVELARQAGNIDVIILAMPPA
jgi:hypothetical protein